MKKLLPCFALSFAVILIQIPSCFSQDFPANTYRTAGNKMYWKNRPPYAGYWQQDVYYKIQASFSDKTGVITGSEQLTYWNNSPDTLKVVYFHMYANAQVKGSYNSMLYHSNKIRTFYGQYEKQGKGIEVTKMESGGQDLKMFLDNTILKVYLNKPLPPNSKMTFDIDFNTYFDMGSMRRRMKVFDHNGFRHFDGVHWYPRLCAYDRKEAWDENQHLDREFYGDYGTYDVSLTMPNNYILGATGVLINQDKVLPPDLRQKLDIKNFASKPLGEKPSVIIPEDGTTKTWMYHAMNVHDFAWTADPTYRIGETTWNGIKVIALAQEEDASRWQTAADFTAKVIEVYSKDFGIYEWPVITVADARDGMEYPMITLCGGLSPDYDYVISHEVGHEWFFGMLGNNETYRAMMDEGFTQFLTAWSMIKIDGPNEKNSPSPSAYVRKYEHPKNTLDAIVYSRYLQGAEDQDNLPINTHSDYFKSAVGQGGGYGQVYFKTATMLYDLQYVLGDSLFQNAMRYYVSKWKICHPYVEDFEDAIIGYTHYNLKWFFDAWITTDKYIDYSVKSVKKDDSTGKYVVTFERKGGIQMPVDFTVYTKEGGKYSYYIPCSYDTKSTTATTLKPWIGWDKLNPEYKAEISANGHITNVVIDTTHRLADVNELDNSLKCPTKLSFDHLLYNAPDRFHYIMYWRPDLWYNAIDGLKAGLHLEGNYMNTEKYFSATAWYNTGFLNNQSAYNNGKTISINPISAIASYGNSLRCLDNSMSWSISARALDGLDMGQIGISKSLRNNFTFNLNYKAMIRPSESDLDYFIYPTQWLSNKWNNTWNGSIKKNYEGFRSWGDYTLAARASGPGSNYNYSTISLDEKHNVYVGKLLVKARAYAAFESGNVPLESQVYLATASPEDMMDNKFVRSVGFFPSSWIGYGTSVNHFTYGGGLGLRGYSGYLAPNNTSEGQNFTYSGNAGAAVNLELDFSQFFKFHPKSISKYISINPYLFGDAGVINALQNGYAYNFSYPRMDAGAGFMFNIKSWGVLNKVQPFSLRFDMPFFLSDAPYVDNNNFMFRWMVGVNRAF